MDKYTIAPPAGSTNNSVGAEDRPWQEGHFDSIKLNGGDLGEYLAESTGYGIVSGCEPTISGLTVTVGAGIVHLADGTRKEIAQTNITLDSADASNPRIDLVYIDSTGTVAKVTGMAAADPSPKILPNNAIGICVVNVTAGATTGTITLKKDTSLQDSYSWVPQFRRTDLPRDNQQDADYYDNKLFAFETDAGTMKVYSVITNDLLATTTLAGGAKPHCNTACFGLKKQASDNYPLIYLTGYNGKDSSNNDLPAGTCFVYKINSNFTTEFIQQISIGFTADDLWKVGTGKPIGVGAIALGNFVVDTDRKRLIVLTCTPTNPCTRIFEFAIPDTNNSAVTLQTTDIIEYYDIPLLSWPQGTAYKDGKIYASHGGGGKTSSVDVIDIASKSIISHIELANFVAEAEGVFFINDRLFVGGTNRYHEVINYKKLSNVGALNTLNTVRRNAITEAINSANSEGLSLQVVNSGPLGIIKFMVVTCKADPGEDYYTAIKNQIVESLDGDTLTNVVFFMGLVSTSSGGGFQRIDGIYRKDTQRLTLLTAPSGQYYNSIFKEYNADKSIGFAYAMNNYTSLLDCKTTNYMQNGAATKYIQVEGYVSILIHGLIGNSNIMRQYILGGNNVGSYKFDSNNDNLITVTAEGNSKYKIVNADSTRYVLTSSYYVTITNS